MDARLERIFRESAIRSANSGVMSRQSGQTALYGEFKRPIDETTRHNRAASQYAEACEHFFKAPIIYHDISKCSHLQTASQEEIEEEIEKFTKKPETIQASVLQSRDFRKNISLALTPGERSTGGHDLFAYYQLQNRVFSTLINHEFLSYDGDNSFNWIDLGILTDDIITQDSDGALLLPESIVISLDKNKRAFADFRYSATHGGTRKAQMTDIDFLVQMSGGLENVMTTLFPPLNAGLDYKESRLESQIGSDIYSFYKPRSGVAKSIESLDIIGNFYLKNDFNKNEFETLLNKLEEINQTRELTPDAKSEFRNVYLNLCIYLKQCSLSAGVNIPFDNKVFNRIENYCKVVMNTNAFNRSATQLRYTSMFAEKKEQLQHVLENYKSQEHNSEFAADSTAEQGEVVLPYHHDKEGNVVIDASDEEVQQKMQDFKDEMKEPEKPTEPVIEPEIHEFIEMINQPEITSLVSKIVKIRTLPQKMKLERRSLSGNIILEKDIIKHLNLELKKDEIDNNYYHNYHEIDNHLLIDEKFPTENIIDLSPVIDNIQYDEKISDSEIIGKVMTKDGWYIRPHQEPPMNDIDFSQIPKDINENKLR